MRRALLFAVLAACGDDAPPPSIAYGTPGPLVGEAGRGGWRFGAASAATQIEDMNTTTDWYVWTMPETEGGLGNGAAFVGDATMGFSKVDEDLALVTDLGLDAYRFSIEWARIEPVRDQIDEAALAHYQAQLEAMRAAGIRPMVTVHHFSNPLWVADPRTPCVTPVDDTNLCGLGTGGGAQIVEEMAEHAALLAERFGGLVDEWCTLNEPMIYLLAGYGLGFFPPGKTAFPDLEERLVPVVRDYVAAHAEMSKAIKAADTTDADGDGVPAAVGLSMSVADWTPTRDNQLSDVVDDVAARDRIVYAFHHVFVDSFVNGTFDANLDGTADEQHPEWLGTLDWLGLQYYFRAGVTGETALIPLVEATPCFGGFDLGACLVTPEPTFCVPRMGYEGFPEGIGDVALQFSARYPDLPLLVTEAGIATDVGKRRAENIVRNLEALERAREAGADLRGYYHWSLTDNFEWIEGYGPHFGLHSVDYTTYARTRTEGADVLAEIAAARTLGGGLRSRHGGTGPMTIETGFELDPSCSKVPAE